jgi:CheY-like chemotaxis protein
MDRRMPVMDGLEAARRIRALPEGDQVKIAAVTASSLKEEDEEIMGAGFDAIVHKPFRPEQIFDCMEELLELRFIRDPTEAAVQFSAGTVSPDDRADLLQTSRELRPILQERRLAPRELMKSLRRLTQTDLPGRPITRLVARIDAFDHDGALSTLAEIEAVLMPTAKG